MSGRLVRMLDAESRRAGLALPNYEGAKGDYRLKGDLNALQDGSTIKVVYSWQVLDRTGAMIGGASGSVPVAGKAGAPWSEIDDPASKTNARTYWTLVVAAPL